MTEDSNHAPLTEVERLSGIISKARARWQTRFVGGQDFDSFLANALLFDPAYGRAAEMREAVQWLTDTFSDDVGHPRLLGGEDGLQTMTAALTRARALLDEDACSRGGS